MIKHIFIPFIIIREYICLFSIRAPRIIKFLKRTYPSLVNSLHHSLDFSPSPLPFFDSKSRKQEEPKSANEGWAQLIILSEAIGQHLARKS